MSVYTNLTCKCNGFDHIRRGIEKERNNKRQFYITDNAHKSKHEFAIIFNLSELSTYKQILQKRSVSSEDLPTGPETMHPWTKSSHTSILFLGKFKREIKKRKGLKYSKLITKATDLYIRQLVAVLHHNDHHCKNHNVFL